MDDPLPKEGIAKQTPYGELRQCETRLSDVNEVEKILAFSTVLYIFIDIRY